MVKSNTTSHTLYIDCFKEYQVAVTSLNAHGESDLSHSRVWNFKTGGSKQCFLNLLKDTLRGLQFFRTDLPDWSFRNTIHVLENPVLQVYQNDAYLFSINQCGRPFLNYYAIYELTCPAGHFQQMVRALSRYSVIVRASIFLLSL